MIDWYKRFPPVDCEYCKKPVNQTNSKRILRVLENDKYILMDVCFSCYPSVRANVLSKKGGVSIIDKNEKMIYSSNPNHVKQILDERARRQEKDESNQ
jgi:hypothetical protein